MPRTPNFQSPASVLPPLEEMLVERSTNPYSEYRCTRCRLQADSHTPIHLYRYNGTYFFACASHQNTISCDLCGVPHYVLRNNGGVNICSACINILPSCAGCGFHSNTIEDGVCLACRTAGWSICPTCHNLKLLTCAHCFARTPDSFKINKFNRTVGFELEFCGNVVPAHVLESVGAIGTDGSVMPSVKEDVEGEWWEGARGAEFRSHPFAGDKLHTAVNMTCSTLRKNYRGFTNRTCGTHVHIYAGDQRQGGIDNLLNWWRVHEYMFFHMLQPARYDNHYCAPCENLTNESWRSTRYRALNRASLSEHSTLEFRLHHGTLDSHRLYNWVQTLLYFFEHYKNEPMRPDYVKEALRRPRRANFADFCKHTNLPISLRKYILASAKTYWTKRCGLYSRGKYVPLDHKPETPPVPEPIVEVEPQSSTPLQWATDNTRWEPIIPLTYYRRTRV